MSGRAPERQSISLPLITATIALLLLAAMLWRFPPSDPYGPYAFGGSACIFIVRSSRRRLFAALAAWPLMAIAFYALHSDAPPPAFVSAAVGFGAATILVSVVGTVRALDRYAALKELAAVVAMPAFALTAATMLYAASGREPLTYDAILAAADRGFGFDASALAARALAQWTILYWTSKFVYDSLPLALCVAVAARNRRIGPEDQERLIWKMILAAGCAFVVFSIVPACGPRFFWGDRFPLATTTADIPLRPMVVSPSDFRNALPSLHFTGALFVAWAFRPFNVVIRSSAWVYAAVTVLATLGSGQHYLIDLVVAIPFAVVVDLTVRREHLATATVALGIVVVWVVLIRWAGTWLASNPWFTLAFAAMSVTVPFVYPWRLRARDARQPLLTPATSGRSSIIAGLPE